MMDDANPPLKSRSISRNLSCYKKYFAEFVGREECTKLNETDLIYEFGQWRLDVVKRCIMRNDVTTELKRRNVFRLLLEFLRQPRKELTKDYLIKAVWLEKAAKGDSVEESNLTHNVSWLRNTLGKYYDEALGKDVDYIETIIGTGYIFTYPVTILNKVDEVRPHFLDGIFSPEKLMEFSPEELIERINQIPSILPKEARAISWIIGKDFVDAWEKQVREAIKSGVILPRPYRRACNVLSLKAARSIEIVEARCFNHKTEWSAYWSPWLESFKDRTDITTRDYYSLYFRQISDQEAANLLAVEKYLKAIGFSIYVCDRSILLDGLGKDLLPQFHSLNIFGETILNISIPCTEEIREKVSFPGGDPLQVSIHDKKKDVTYGELYKLITENRREVTSALVESLQTKS